MTSKLVYRHSTTKLANFWWFIIFPVGLLIASLNPFNIYSFTLGILLALFFAIGGAKRFLFYEDYIERRNPLNPFKRYRYKRFDKSTLIKTRLTYTVSRYGIGYNLFLHHKDLRRPVLVEMNRSISEADLRKVMGVIMKIDVPIIMDKEQFKDSPLWDYIKKNDL